MMAFSKHGASDHICQYSRFRALLREKSRETTSGEQQIVCDERRLIFQRSYLRVPMFQPVVLEYLRLIGSHLHGLRCCKSRAGEASVFLDNQYCQRRQFLGDTAGLNGIKNLTQPDRNHSYGLSQLLIGHRLPMTGGLGQNSPRLRRTLKFIHDAEYLACTFTCWPTSVITSHTLFKSALIA